MVRYWGIRLGSGGRYVSSGKKGDYVAIGWNTLGDLSWLAEGGDDKTLSKKLRRLYRQTYEEESKIAQSIGIGQIIRFVREIQIGDIVLVPDPIEREVLIGKIRGGYKYRKRWGDECTYAHRRKVEWIRIVDRDTLPEKLKYSVGSLLTVFSLDPRKDLIDALVGKKKRIKTPHVVSGKDLVEATIDRLYDLSPRDFEILVMDLLGSMGFEAAVTEYVGDKGVDVIGTLNAEGLVQVTLRVQVKRIRSKVGVDTVLRIRGALEREEYGAIITTSEFTKSAQEEAQQEAKKSIALIDGELLTEIILRHYDQLPDKVKTLLKLERKEIPIRDTFYTSIVS